MQIAFVFLRTELLWYLGEVLSIVNPQTKESPLKSKSTVQILSSVVSAIKLRANMKAKIRLIHPVT